MSKIEAATFSLEETAKNLGVSVQDVITYISIGELKVNQGEDGEAYIGGWDLVDFVERNR